MSDFEDYEDKEEFKQLAFRRNQEQMFHRHNNQDALIMMSSSKVKPAPKVASMQEAGKLNQQSANCLLQTTQASLSGGGGGKSQSQQPLAPVEVNGQELTQEAGHMDDCMAAMVLMFLSCAKEGTGSKEAAALVGSKQATATSNGISAKEPPTSTNGNNWKQNSEPIEMDTSSQKQKLHKRHFKRPLYSDSLDSFRTTGQAIEEMRCKSRRRNALDDESDGVDEEAETEEEEGEQVELAFVESEPRKVEDEMIFELQQVDQLDDWETSQFVDETKTRAITRTKMEKETNESSLSFVAGGFREKPKRKSVLEPQVAIREIEKPTEVVNLFIGSKGKQEQEQCQQQQRRNNKQQLQQQQQQQLQPVHQLSFRMNNPVKTRTIFSCMWPGCTKNYDAIEDIERHVRSHLGPKQFEATGEEDFYYEETEVDEATYLQIFKSHLPLSPSHNSDGLSSGQSFAGSSPATSPVCSTDSSSSNSSVSSSIGFTSSQLYASSLDWNHFLADHNSQLLRGSPNSGGGNKWLLSDGVNKLDSHIGRANNNNNSVYHHLYHPHPLNHHHNHHHQSTSNPSGFSTDVRQVARKGPGRPPLNRNGGGNSVRNLTAAATAVVADQHQRQLAAGKGKCKRNNHRQGNYLNSEQLAMRFSSHGDRSPSPIRQRLDLQQQQQQPIVAATGRPSLQFSMQLTNGSPVPTTATVASLQRHQLPSPLQERRPFDHTYTSAIGSLITAPVASSSSLNVTTPTTPSIAAEATPTTAATATTTTTRRRKLAGEQSSSGQRGEQPKLNLSQQFFHNQTSTSSGRGGAEAVDETTTTNKQPANYNNHQINNQARRAANQQQQLASSPSSQVSSNSSSIRSSLSCHKSETGSPPTRRIRGENRKCRKVYGMERRDMWCTQCKWKKACSRFCDP